MKNGKNRKTLSAQAKEAAPKTEENGIEEELSKIPFSVVGIGASAGGLEAFTVLLKNLPADTGMAFILVQHLSPTHKSMLTDILSKNSPMPVTEATNRVEVVPNHVYVIPPNACMSILDGFLHIEERSKSEARNLPIDHFLCSLAEYQKDKAIAVILSGTASDGSLGVKVVKGYGGIVFAQDETAKFDMMPKNAVATGSVDFILSPEKIAKELANLSHHPYISAEAKMDLLVPETDVLRQILMLLRKTAGIDFTNYKTATIKRRILRRMILNKIDTLKKYVSFLVNNPKEAQVLSQEIFITVTRFFRDTETFIALEHDVFLPLIKNRISTDPIRVWTTGCSTGEEAYSLAMNIAEFLEKKDKTDTPVQIFATDILEPSIEHARLGIYSDNIANDVSPERLKKFFRKIDKGYQINKSIREMCVFAQQNITADPPFSKLDLISCRNLLIYLDSTAQKRIIPIFHYALNPGGFLLLGQSESVVAHPELFKPVNRKAKIYSKNPVQITPPLALSRSYFPQISTTKTPTIEAHIPSVADIQKEADRVVLKTVNHCGVVVSEAMEVIQFRGDTSRYLKHVSGTASMSLSKWAEEGLYVEIRNQVHKAQEKNTSFKTELIRIKHREGSLDVSIKVTPFKVPPKGQRYFLIVFEESVSPVLPRLESKDVEKKKKKVPSSDKDLLEELESTQQYLQGVVDDKEAANEELQAANEEIVSTNEELQSLNEEFQSSNEELESAKEELQATNEEINTLNDELQSRNIRLAELNDEQINLMESINLPLVMVGRDLKVRRFTPAAENVLRLVQNDIGRTITDIKSDIDLQDLEALMFQVMTTGVLKELELLSQKAGWYKIQIRPYKTGDNKIDGAVVTFFDVTKIKALAAIVDSSDEAIISRDLNGVITTWNKGAERLFGYTAQEVVGQATSLIPSNRQEEENEILDRLKRGERIDLYETERVCKNGSMLEVSLMVSPVKDADGRIIGASKIIRDISERKKAEKARQQLQAQLAREADALTKLHQFSSRLWQMRSMSEGLNEMLDATIELLGADMGNIQLLDEKRSVLRIEVHRGFKEGFLDYFREVSTEHNSACGRTLRSGERIVIEDVETDAPYAPMRPIAHAAGYRAVQSTPLIGRNGAPLGIISTHFRSAHCPNEQELRRLDLYARQAADFIERCRAEETLRESEERYRTLFDLGPVAVYSCDISGVIQKFNRHASELWGREPALGDTEERFCGSFKLFRPDGSFMPHEQCPMAEVLSGKISETDDAEVLIERPDGSRITVIVNIRPMKNQLGEVTGAINCFYNITERKRTEEKLAHLNQELEQFTSIASHDLQEPLRKIMNYTEILASPDSGENKAQYFPRLAKAAMRMKNLIEALLDFSKTDQKREFQSVNLKEIVSKVVDDLDDEQAEITFDELPIIQGDEILLRQLFCNLIENAIKYKKKNETCKISITAKSMDGSHEIRVKDSGIGFDVKYLAKIFKPLQRLHGNEYQGSGIGLATCEKIVRHHRGSITANSKVGKGSTFIITLPKNGG